MSEQLTVDGRPRIRRSAAESKLACEDFQREDSEHLAFGQAVHSFVAAWHAVGRQIGREPEYLRAAVIAREVWGQTLGLDQSRRQEFLDLCQGYAQSHLLNLETLVAWERLLEWDVGWAVLQCRYDVEHRLPSEDPDDVRKVLLWDLKTEHSEMDHEFQRRWYVKMRLLTNPHLEWCGFQLDPLRRGGLPDPVWYKRGDQVLEEWWQDTLAALKERYLHPTHRRYGGRHCHDCRERVECPQAVATAAHKPSSEEQARAMIREWQRLQAGHEAHKTALAAWANGREPIVEAGVVVGWLTAKPRRDGSPGSFRLTGSPAAIAEFCRQSEIELPPMSMAISRPPFDNWGVRLKLINAGLAEFWDGEPEFKARAAPPRNEGP